MSDRRLIPGPVQQAVSLALLRGIDRDVSALLGAAEVRQATEYHNSPRNAVRRALMNVMEEERQATQPGEAGQAPPPGSAPSPPS